MAKRSAQVSFCNLFPPSTNNLISLSPPILSLTHLPLHQYIIKIETDTAWLAKYKIKLIVLGLLLQYSLIPTLETSSLLSVPFNPKYILQDGTVTPWIHIQLSCRSTKDNLALRNNASGTYCGVRKDMYRVIKYIANVLHKIHCERPDCGDVVAPFPRWQNTFDFCKSVLS